MRRWLVLAGAILAAASAFGYLGQVIASYASPAGTNTRGLAMASGVLFVSDSNSPAIIYRINPSSGTTSSWYNLPFTGSPSGLAYTSSGDYLWVSIPSNDYVYRCNAVTGSLYGSWSAGHNPAGLAPLGTGDGGSGATQIFTSDNGPARFWRHYLSNGSLISTVTISNGADYDCAYDWRNSLLWVGTATYLYGYTMSGTLTGSFASPAANPRGLAYYGAYLYVGCTSNGRIYVVHCPSGFVGVTASSMSRVKSLYR
jgi:hypothetical protein